MILAQISDLHLTEPGQPVYGRYETETALAACIRALNAMRPRPNAVLITGDLVHDGAPAQYRNLLRLLDDLEIPWYPMVGNHDSRPVFRDALEDRFPGLWDGAFIQFTFDLDPLRVIALDTLDEGYHTPAFCDERLDWLEVQLAAAGDRPVILALHQPPFATGLDWLDGGGTDWAEGLRAQVAAHDNVKIVLCGHVHRSIERPWAGTLASVCPSTCYQSWLDLQCQRAGFVMEPPAIRLLVWDGEEIVSHLQPLVNVGPPWQAIAPEVLKRLMDHVARTGTLPKDINSRERGLEDD